MQESSPVSQLYLCGFPFQFLLTPVGDFPVMPDGQDQDDQPLVLNPVDDAMVADPIAPKGV
jgi:hypothetical protein